MTCAIVMWELFEKVLSQSMKFRIENRFLFSSHMMNWRWEETITSSSSGHTYQTQNLRIQCRCCFIIVSWAIRCTKFHVRKGNQLTQLTRRVWLMSVLRRSICPAETDRSTIKCTKKEFSIDSIVWSRNFRTVFVFICRTHLVHLICVLCRVYVHNCSISWSRQSNRIESDLNSINSK